jgi:hypothetical protein
MKKVMIFAFLTVAVLGIIKIVSIALFDRMSADDFSYTAVAFTHGVFKAQLIWYNSFTGKFINNFLVTVFGMLSSANGSTTLYFFITLALLFSAILIFLKKIVGSRMNFFYTLLLSALFLVSYYLITPNKNESWYWLSGAVEYLWPTIFALVAIGFSLEKRQNLPVRLALFLLGFLIGGGSEVNGTIFVVGIFFSLLLIAFKNFFEMRDRNLGRFLGILFNQNALFGNLLFAFAGAAASFSIMFFAPGNVIRIKGPGSDEMSIAGAVFYSLQKGPELLLSMVKENAVYLGSLTVILSAFFYQQKVIIDSEESDEKQILKKIFFILVIPLFLSFFYMLPGYKALGRVLPDRAEINLSFVILLSLLFTALYIAKLFEKFNLSKYFIYNVTITFIAMIFFISSVAQFTGTVAEDVYITKNYSDSFDRMFNQLKEVSKTNKDQVVIVEAFPESGLIHSEKLNSDPGHWANKPISNFFGLKGIKVEEPTGENLDVKN